MAKYTVDGYVFESIEVAQKAQKELEVVQYIRSQTKMNEPDIVMELYERLILQDIFQTQIGISFLRELQEYLQSIPYIKKENISPIPIKTQRVESEKSTIDRLQSEPETIHRNEYKKKFQIASFFCVVFCVGLIGVFLITYFSGNNTNIFNYEQQIIDKYEKWEQELEERELELDKREEKIQQMTN